MPRLLLPHPLGQVTARPLVALATQTPVEVEFGEEAVGRTQVFGRRITVCQPPGPTPRTLPPRRAAGWTLPAAQAKDSGYSYQAQAHHVAAGNWRCEWIAVCFDLPNGCPTCMTTSTAGPFGPEIVRSSRTRPRLRFARSASSVRDASTSRSPAILDATRSPCPPPRRSSHEAGRGQPSPVRSPAPTPLGVGAATGTGSAGDPPDPHR